ncbi:MAG: Holliday junction resolvase RuvX [FCB group bacterium]|nr:Holliday junction resolvase RuvX [FCB group bacterium]
MAVSDPLGIIAQPLLVIDQKKTPDYVAELLKVLQDFNIRKIVVGMPLSMKGTDSQQTKIVRDFISELNTQTEIPIVSVDERLSSSTARSRLITRGVRTGHHKGEIDKAAACVILQEFLDTL